MPRCQDIKNSLRARGQILSMVGFPLSGSDPQNPSFLHPATTMATYQHNPLFTIQKLGIPGAAATKISIFWYPETSLKQQSTSKAAKQHSSKVPSQQLSSQAVRVGGSAPHINIYIYTYILQSASYSDFKSEGIRKQFFQQAV